MEKVSSSEKLVAVYPNTGPPVTNGSHPHFNFRVPVYNFAKIIVKLA
jgi:hypothetical protein